LAHCPLLTARVGDVIGDSVLTGVSVVSGAAALVGLGISVGVGYEQAERIRIRKRKPIFPMVIFPFNLILPF
jgi:hypothetical protein